jgi:hypothetical protein
VELARYSMMGDDKEEDLEVFVKRVSLRADGV